jgi:alpha-glucosidase
VPDTELLIRWTQALLLHPRFIMNSWKPDGVYTSPWLHPSATPAIQTAIQLWYRLIPYLYSLMHEGAEQDSPVLRSTFVQFEDDPRCFDDRDELMCGPFLLAAPVVAPGERVRRAYLPNGPGCWFDFYSEERLAAGQEATLAAPLDRVPLVVPEGAIIPMTDAAADFSRLHDEHSRRIRLFPGKGSGASRFVLTEDNGISASGARTRITLDLSWTPEQVARLAQAEGTYAVPAGHIAIALPAPERRRLVLHAGDGVSPLRSTI